MTGNAPDAETRVRARLADCGRNASEDEGRTLVAGYPQVQEMISSLYLVPGVQDEVPAITFGPRPGRRD